MGGRKNPGRRQRGAPSNLQTNDGMTGTLVYDQTIFGDWHICFNSKKQSNELTPAQIQRVARKIFVKDSETVAILESVKKP